MKELIWFSFELPGHSGILNHQTVTPSLYPPKTRSKGDSIGPWSNRTTPFGLSFAVYRADLQALSERLFWAVLDQLQKFSPGFATGRRELNRR